MQHPRLVSAGTFAASAAFVGLLLLGLAGAQGGLGPMSAGFIWAPLAVAVPAALVGFLAGPRVVAARSAGGAALLGVGVTVFSAVAYVLGVFSLVTAVEVSGVRPADVGDLVSPELWGITLVVGLALSPVGALAAWAVWRHARRAARPA